MLPNINENAFIHLIYDGDCPLCRSFSEKVKIEEKFGPLELINARNNLSLAATLEKYGYPLDKGNVLILGNAYYQGADAVRLISIMSTSPNLLNRLVNFLFHSNQTARVFYPIMRTIRLILLTLLHKPTFSQALMDNHHGE